MEDISEVAVKSLSLQPDAKPQTPKPRSSKNDVLRVSSSSNPNAIAGALASILKTQSRTEINVIGAAALNQAIKAIAIARGYMAPIGKDVICFPAFAEMKIDGMERTAIRLIIETR